ncbi:mandelate racemase/muconate lactonizing enzyme family protein [Planctomicrobium sp. SH664]|uniref:mandelate racemase/muconate lactonizing enzyme family protein n=1 Tax=Planctomicrobium sp. SH664 TaxID=3448125 RepID=UPI003F5B3A6A
MKITRIETIPASVNVDRRVGQVQNRKGFRFQSQILVIIIQTDKDLDGIGEVTASADWSGETCLGAKLLIDRHLAPMLIGEDPRRIRACMDLLSRTFANPFAKAGIEMALFDLLGRSLETPVSQLLGGVVRDAELPLRFPIMPVGPQESADVARRMVAEGFRMLKLKVGHDPLEYDLERIRLVREAVGPEIRLTVDANGGWSVNDAIRISPHLEEYGIAFIEQPVHRLDLDGLAAVRSRIRLPVMADESVFTVQDALKCLQKGAADIISVSPGKNGGLFNVLTIASLAEAAGVHCSMGSNLEWDIASAAMAQACASIPNIRVDLYAADIIGPIFHTEHVARPSLIGLPGHVRVPQGPGLGITLDRDRLTGPPVFSDGEA